MNTSTHPMVVHQWVDWSQEVHHYIIVIVLRVTMERIAKKMHVDFVTLMQYAKGVDAFVKKVMLAMVKYAPKKACVTQTTLVRTEELVKIIWDHMTVFVQLAGRVNTVKIKNTANRIPVKTVVHASL